MNTQGHVTHDPTPATPAKHTGTNHHQKHHGGRIRHTNTPARPVSHRPATHHHKTHKQHKSAPRNSMPVETLVQAMQWFVAPAAC